MIGPDICEYSQVEPSTLHFLNSIVNYINKDGI